MKNILIVLLCFLCASCAVKKHSESEKQVFKDVKHDGFLVSTYQQKTQEAKKTNSQTMTINFELDSNDQIGNAEQVNEFISNLIGGKVPGNKPKNPKDKQPKKPLNISSIGVTNSEEASYKEENKKDSIAQAVKDQAKESINEQIKNDMEQSEPLIIQILYYGLILAAIAFVCYLAKKIS